MKNIPDLREVPDLPSEIKEAALDGGLVLFVGAGVSKRVKLPGWPTLALNVLEDLLDKGFLNYSELEQLKVLEPKKQLSIARLIAEEKKYELDFTVYFEKKESKSEIYKDLNAIGCPCVTTNYDELLEPKFFETDDGSTTPTSIKRIFEKKEFFSGHLNEPGTVIHLHGAISAPHTMVVTTKEYLEHYDDDMVKDFLGELFAKKTVLFLGYGLEEEEILEHILRKGSVRNIIEKRRFALQGFFFSEKPLYEKLYDYYLKTFGVHLIGFVRDYKDYEQLDDIIKSWALKIVVRKPALVEDFKFMGEVLGDA